eukprot:gene537-biopygen9133
MLRTLETEKPTQAVITLAVVPRMEGGEHKETCIDKDQACWQKGPKGYLHSQRGVHDTPDQREGDDEGIAGAVTVGHVPAHQGLMSLP